MHHRKWAGVALQRPYIDHLARLVSQLICVEQMSDGRGIKAATAECGFNGLLQLGLPVLWRQPEQFDHLPGAVLFSVPLHQCLPDSVEACRPQPSLASLFQRFQSSQRTGFAI
jgi:hypothetical protein